MERWKCPICNGTLETFIWSKMLMILTVFLTWKTLLFFSSPLLFINKECASLFPNKPQMKKNEKLKPLNDNSYLIKQSYEGYLCKSDIAIYAMIEGHRMLLNLTLSETLQNVLALVKIIFLRVSSRNEKILIRIKILFKLFTFFRFP